MIATAPAAAIQSGWIPSGELSRKPTSVAPSTASAKRGKFGASGASTLSRGRSSSDAKKRVRTTHSTAIAAAVGRAISIAKRVNDRPLAWKASRFVRLEIGNNNEAEFARCATA